MCANLKLVREVRNVEVGEVGALSFGLAGRAARVICHRFTGGALGEDEDGMAEDGAEN